MNYKGRRIDFHVKRSQKKYGSTDVKYDQQCDIKIKVNWIGKCSIRAIRIA